MTDLQSRPRPAASSSTTSTAASSGTRRTEPGWWALLAGSAPEGRPLALGAALGAAAAIGVTLGLTMAVAVIGWFLADAGAHGQTTDALRVGADVWLVGHGSGFSVSGTTLGIVPLAITALLGLAVFRCARWAGSSSAPVDDDRSVALAATVFTGLYLVVVVVLSVVLASGSSGPVIGRAILGSLLMAGVVGTLGLASGAGRLPLWVARVPRWVRAVAHGAAAGVLVLLAAASLLVAVMLALGLNDAAAMMSGLRLGPGDHVAYAVASVAVVPNAVLLGASYLLGPGFALGTGTIVSPTMVSLGPVPAFPLLAAVPGDGATPSWAVGVLAVPVLAGATGAVMAQRAYRVTAYDSAALRGFGSGLGAALLITVAVALAGGSMGSGRMADIGAPLGEVLVASMASMSLGGLVGGLATAWWQRRGAEPTEQAQPAPVPEPAADPAGDPAEPPTAGR